MGLNIIGTQVEAEKEVAEKREKIFFWGGEDCNY
jgi:hypothetical protein